MKFNHNPYKSAGVYPDLFADRLCSLAHGGAA
jgi:hypothetical protein